MVFYRKYNVLLSGGTLIRIPMPKAGSADFATSSDWTPASGDVQISKDDGTLANIGTLPTYSNGCWNFVLSAAELTCKCVCVRIVDSATKAVDDNAFIVETFGDAAAMHTVDYTNAATFGLSALADIYHADIQFTRDEANATDEYTVSWFKNGVRVTSGITSPTLQGIKRSDGTNLFAASSMTEVGSTHHWKLDKTTTSRQTVGEALILQAVATIDGSSRTYTRNVGRDST